MRHHLPFTSGALDIEDAVENFSEIDGPGTPEAFGLGEKRLNNLPFGIAEVTGVEGTRWVIYFR